MFLIMSFVGSAILLLIPLSKPLVDFIGLQEPTSILPFNKKPPFSCKNQKFDVHIFSTDPLMIYLPSFVSPEEADLVEQAAVRSSFNSSLVIGDLGQEKWPHFRTSKSSFPARTEAIRCIEDRALAFQGRSSTGVLEGLQVVRYETGEQFKHHNDWAGAAHIGQLGTNRETSFFVYLKANCTGGGTNFPRVARPADEWWCQYIDCTVPYGDGVTFKPIAGNAIFWQNLLPDGSGDEGTLHAGMPVISGLKLGLNIWTREANKTSV